MIKEFKIIDILNAVDIISEKKRKKAIKNDSDNKNDILNINKPVKASKSEILVLDQMIE